MLVYKQSNIFNYINQCINNNEYNINDLVIDMINKIDYNNINISLDDIVLDIKQILEIEFNIYDLDLVGLKDKLMEIRESRKDYNFRKSVLMKYDRCLITNYGVRRCEIAHIKPFSVCNDNEKYDHNNGLLLDSSIHKLFDKYEFTIDPETFEMIVKDDPDNDLGLNEYNGKKLDISLDSREYIRYHYNEYINRL